MKRDAIDVEFAELSFNARLLLKELHKRGVQLKSLDATYIVKATYADRFELIYDLYTSNTTYPAGIMIDDKYYTKRLLQKFGFPSPAGKVFTYKQTKQALKFSKEIGFPVVLKPTVGSHGDYVYMDIETEQELQDKIEVFAKERIGNGYYLVEEQFSGNEYRLFVTKDGFFAAVHRDPANVIGDGVSDLASLVQTENFRRMNPRDTCLCEIRLDKPAMDFLNKQGLTTAYVSKKGEKVFLRKNSNVSTGGNCYDVTDQIHPSVVKLAKDILAALQAPFIGIDLLCESVTVDLAHQQYTICELNGAPGLSLHMMPERGKPRDTAKAVADTLFPETKR